MARSAGHREEIREAQRDGLVRYTPVVGIDLPPSLRSDLHSIEQEVAWARALTPEERLVVVDLVCRDTVAVLTLNPARERVVSGRDSLPASTVAALARLRQRG